MANPIDFEGSNVLFGAPSTMTAEECGDLPCFFDGDVVVSCWELTPDELEHVMSTGQVWLMVWGGGTPPVCITGEKPLVEADPTQSQPPAQKNVREHDRWGEYMAHCKKQMLLPTEAGFLRWLDSQRIILPGGN